MMSHDIAFALVKVAVAYRRGEGNCELRSTVSVWRKRHKPTLTFRRPRSHSPDCAGALIRDRRDDNEQREATNKAEVPCLNPWWSCGGHTRRSTRGGRRGGGRRTASAPSRVAQREPRGKT